MVEAEKQTNPRAVDCRRPGLARISLNAFSLHDHNCSRETVKKLSDVRRHKMMKTRLLNPK
jgi:hypothetical protein